MTKWIILLIATGLVLPTTITRVIASSTPENYGATVMIAGLFTLSIYKIAKKKQAHG
jgi:hypothetical protein